MEIRVAVVGSGNSGTDLLLAHAPSGSPRRDLHHWPELPEAPASRPPRCTPGRR